MWRLAQRVMRRKLRRSFYLYKKKREKHSSENKRDSYCTKGEKKAKRKQNRGNKRQKSDMKKNTYCLQTLLYLGNIRKMNFQRLLILWKIINTIWKKKSLFYLPLSPRTYNIKFYFFLLPHLIRFIFTGNELWFFILFLPTKKILRI